MPRLCDSSGYADGMNPESPVPLTLCGMFSSVILLGLPTGLEMNRLRGNKKKSQRVNDLKLIKTAPHVH